MAKKLNGFTANSNKNYVLETGIFFYNYNIESDTVESAKADGKCFGMTNGGGQFTAKPVVSQLQFDNMGGVTKGSEQLQYWEAEISANICEMSDNNLQKLLGSAEIDSVSNEKYNIIAPKAEFEDGDYLENITYVGTLSAQQGLFIIQIYNALNTEGISFTMKDGGQATTNVKFKAHYDESGEVPFKIFNPKRTV